MSPEVSERVFERAIECGLLQGGPDACAEDAISAKDIPVSSDRMNLGGYQKRRPEEYDRELCLLARDVVDFVVATQPREWQRLGQHHGPAVRDQFLQRLASELQARGSLDVLRNGLKDSGVKFRLAFFRPASALNEETRRLHAANVFSIVRQLHYSTKDAKSLDLALFLNGIPIFTAELKNPLNGQDVQDAMRQYRNDRDPREPLFGQGRCLAHFAVDPDLVYVTTRLAGERTRFLPFNKGRFGGAGNPPVPPTQKGYASSYLWEDTWTRDSVLDLVRQFIQEVQEEDDKGRRSGQRRLIFPRYQQLDCVRRLVADARQKGAGQRYLVQHSAGSGKSFTIAWLAHHLAILHDAGDRRVFDSIVVVTDRRVLDRQLQNTMRQFEQTLGVVENIDTTSRQLKEALESGKSIIVTTLQKFPVIAEQIGELPGKRFAVIVDEAHSSQSGENTRTLRSVLSDGTLEAAEKEEAGSLSPEEELNNVILAEIEKRGPVPNVSTFAFTATPKSKTLELFGTRQPDGSYAPFHLYSMRQAIEEGFILDVLANYTTYKAYWRLLKKVQDDPRYDRKKAEYLLKSFVELHPHAIAEKARVMVDHFASQVQAEIGGRAKAMIVTRSRRHAVRFKLAIDRLLAERGHTFKALVAFSGRVDDCGQSYTEAGMNGFTESQTAKTFDLPEYRLLVAANKFQTGFDQPLLHTMYVDKKLGGVNAVQTLSRLNRTHPQKKGTMVLDFENDAEEIRKAFEPYYETTLLSEATDPNLLYTLQTQLSDFGVFSQADLDGFARTYFDPKASMDMLYAALASSVQRAGALAKEERHDFRDKLTDYIRLYSFLAQVLTFADVDLEKLYVFGRGLRRLLREERDTLPLEVQQNIDMESYRLQQTASGKIGLKRGSGTLEPVGPRPAYGPLPEDLEPLSRIIAELNERFGLSLGPEHRVTLGQIMGRLDEDSALDAAARVNTRENVRLSFDQKVESAIQEIVDSNFTLYKRITDDRAFGEAVKNLLFDQYLHAHRNAEDLIKRSASKSLEFIPTLRWNVEDNREDRQGTTVMVLKAIAAFLNSEGGDVLLGVAPGRELVGMEKDQFESDDAAVRYLEQAVRDGLGEGAVACIEPKIQVVDGRMVCVVSCRRSPGPVYLRDVGDSQGSGGQFYIRSGSKTLQLAPASVPDYARTRFGTSSASAS